MMTTNDELSVFRAEMDSLNIDAFTNYVDSFIDSANAVGPYCGCGAENISFRDKICWIRLVNALMVRLHIGNGLWIVMEGNVVLILSMEIHTQITRICGHIHDGSDISVYWSVQCHLR